MFPRRTNATLLGAGLTLACLTTGAAAHAAPAPHSTSNTAAGTAFSSTRTITPNTVTSTATIDGDRAIVTLTGQPGQKITIHDSTGRPIAGTTLTTTTGTITFTAPTSHQEYTVHADGQTVDSAAFSLRDDIVTPDTKPVVDDVDKQGARAIVDVTAAPRALVKVKNDNGKTLGLRMADNTGHTSIPVPVAPNDDTALKVSQTNAGQESDDEDAYSLTEITSVEASYTGVSQAVLRIKAFLGGRVVVTAPDGTPVWDGDMDFSLDGTRVVVPVVKGETTTYSVTRTNPWGASKPKTVDIAGDAAALGKPTATYLDSYTPRYIRVVCTPEVAVSVTDTARPGWPSIEVCNLGGVAHFPNPIPGHTYEIVQRLGTDVSGPALLTIPTA